MKELVKEVCSDLPRPTVALFHTPIWGMGTLAASLSSSPRDAVRGHKHFPGSHMKHTFAPPLHMLCPISQPVPGPLASSAGFFLQTEGSSGATEKMKKGLSDFLGVISDTFAPSPDKTIDCDVITLMGTPSGTAEPYDGTKVFISSLPCRCQTALDSSFQPVLSKAIQVQAKK